MIAASWISSEHVTVSFSSDIAASSETIKSLSLKKNSLRETSRFLCQS